MEILGDDEAGLPTPAPRRWPIGTDDRRAPPALGGDLDVTPDPDGTRDEWPPSGADDDQVVTTGTTDGTTDGQGPADVAAGRARLWLDTVFAPEALGIAGLLVAVVGATTTGFSPFVVMIHPELLDGTPNSERSLPDLYGSLVGLFGLLALALGVAAVLRVRPTSSAWTRGVAGAAVLLAAFMLLATAYALWTTGDPTAPSDAVG